MPFKIKMCGGINTWFKKTINLGLSALAIYISIIVIITSRYKQPVIILFVISIPTENV